MAKRKSLSFDSDQLTNDLKESAGKGVDAFFSPTLSVPQAEKAKTKRARGHFGTGRSPTRKERDIGQRKRPISHKSRQTNNITSNIESNITILQLQFNDVDIEELKEPAYKPQTYRMTTRDVEWFKDTAYRLSKDVKRGRVTQADILKICKKIFEKLLETNKADVIEILERVK